MASVQSGIAMIISKIGELLNDRPLLCLNTVEMISPIRRWVEPTITYALSSNFQGPFWSYAEIRSPPIQSSPEQRGSTADNWNAIQKLHAHAVQCCDTNEFHRCATQSQTHLPELLLLYLDLPSPSHVLLFTKASIPRWYRYLDVLGIEN